MIFNPYPTPRDFGAVPAGPVTCLGVQIARRARDEYLEHLSVELRREVWRLERESRPVAFGFQLEEL